MKKVCKTIIPLALFAMMIGQLLSFSAVPVRAKGKSVVTKRIEQIRKEFPNKSKMNEEITVGELTGGGCNALEMYLTLRVFHNCYTPGCDTYKRIGSVSTGNTNAMKKLFKRAKIGDVVRFRRGGTDAHYAIFLSCDSTGVNLYESNFGGKNVVRYNNHWPWSAMKSWPTGGASKVDVYRAKNYNKVNKKKSAKLYKKGHKIQVENWIFKVTEVSGFGGSVKLVGFNEEPTKSDKKLPKYIYVDNLSEKNVNCNFDAGYGSTKRGGMDYQMVYKVTGATKNAYTNIKHKKN